MRLRTIGPAFALTLLGACGGGGGGSQVSLTTVSGTVVADAALAGYTVEVYTPTNPPSEGVSAASGKTGPDGGFSATSHLEPIRPLLIDVRAPGFTPDEWRYRVLHSVSHSGVNVNVTPLTELLVARLLNRRVSPLDFAAANELQNRTEADVSAARQQVVAYLLNRPGRDDGNVISPVDVSAVTDFASMPLNAVPGDPHFDALKRVHDSLMLSESIQGVEEHMLFGNDPPADLRAMLSLDFMANCLVQGTDDGTFPSGPTRIILDRRAITLGSFDFAFQTGDRLQVEHDAASRNHRWFFGFTGRAGVTLNILRGRLSSIEINLPTANFSSSTCIPLSALSLAGKLPSALGLTFLLSQSLDPSREFQCAGPITWPGFLVAPDTNFLFFDQKGAVRINGLSGTSLHVPSMFQFVIEAPLVVAAGQLSPIRPTSFSTSISFVGSNISDRFEVRLTDTGQITGLNLSNAHSQQAQSCGI